MKSWTVRGLGAPPYNPRIVQTWLLRLLATLVPLWRGLHATPVSASAWDGTLQKREYVLLVVSLVTLLWLMPFLNCMILLGTALATYMIGAAPLRRNQKLGILLLVLSVFLTLKHRFPRPMIPYVLWGQTAIEAFFTLRCADFALSQRLEAKRLGALDRFGRFVLWMFFLPTVFAGPVASYGDFYRCYQPRLANWHQIVPPNAVKIVWGWIKFVLLAAAIQRLVSKLWAVSAGSVASGHLVLLMQLDPRLLIGLAIGLEHIAFYLVFSGFTDIAIGLARLLGFNLYENFDRPLWSTNPVQYWKTSNISTYRWLMTHVFFPYWDHTQITAKVITTFIVSALWHCTVVPVGHWEGMLQVVLAFAVFSVVVTVLMQYSRTAWGTRRVLAGHHALVQGMIWAGKVAINFCFLAFIHKLFWNGLSGQPIATIVQVYQHLFFGVR